MSPFSNSQNKNRVLRLCPLAFPLISFLPKDSHVSPQCGPASVVFVKEPCEWLGAVQCLEVLVAGAHKNVTVHFHFEKSFYLTFLGPHANSQPLWADCCCLASPPHCLAPNEMCVTNSSRQCFSLLFASELLLGGPQAQRSSGHRLQTERNLSKYLKVETSVYCKWRCFLSYWRGLNLRGPYQLLCWGNKIPWGHQSQLQNPSIPGFCPHFTPQKGPMWGLVSRVAEGSWTWVSIFIPGMEAFVFSSLYAHFFHSTTHVTKAKPRKGENWGLHRWEVPPHQCHLLGSHPWTLARQAHAKEREKIILSLWEPHDPQTFNRVRLPPSDILVLYPVLTATSRMPRAGERYINKTTILIVLSKGNNMRYHHFQLSCV